MKQENNIMRRLPRLPRHKHKTTRCVGNGYTPISMHHSSMEEKLFADFPLFHREMHFPATEMHRPRHGMKLTEKYSQKRALICEKIQLSTQQTPEYCLPLVCVV